MYCYVVEGGVPRGMEEQRCLMVLWCVVVVMLLSMVKFMEARMVVVVLSF